jgi:ATP-dependent Zn protease
MMALILWTVLRYYGLAHLPGEITYSQFLDEVRAKQVSKIRFRKHNEVTGTYREAQRGQFYTWVPANDPELYGLLSANGVETEVDESPTWIAVFPWLVAGIFMLLMLFYLPIRIRRLRSTIARAKSSQRTNST